MEVKSDYHPSIPDDGLARRVVDVISDIYGVDKSEIHSDHSYKDCFCSDEVDDIDFIESLEFKFDITIEEGDENKLTDVRSTIEYVQERCHKQEKILQD